MGVEQNLAGISPTFLTFLDEKRPSVRLEHAGYPKHDGISDVEQDSQFLTVLDGIINFRPDYKGILNCQNRAKLIKTSRNDRKGATFRTSTNGDLPGLRYFPQHSQLFSPLCLFRTLMCLSHPGCGRGVYSLLWWYTQGGVGVYSLVYHGGVYPECTYSPVYHPGYTTVCTPLAWSTYPLPHSAV